MTIETTNNKIAYAANGIIDTFAFNFKTFDGSSIKVYENNTATTSVVTVFLNADQDVSPGGSVLLSIPPSNGFRVTVKRENPLIQNKNYISGGSFPAESHEQALDSAIMVSQQQQEELSRKMGAPVGDDGSTSMDMPSYSARRALVWDQNSKKLVNSETDIDTAAASAAAAAISESNAAAAAAAALSSENNASDSENAALISENAAFNSSTNSSISASNASTSENNALLSEGAASDSEQQALFSQNNSSAAASAAAASDASAAISATSAGNSAAQAGAAAGLILAYPDATTSDNIAFVVASLSINAPVSGTIYKVKMSAGNTLNTSMTLNIVDTVVTGPLPVTLVNGKNPYIDAVGVSQIAEFMFNGTNWVLLNPLAPVAALHARCSTNPVISNVITIPFDVAVSDTQGDYNNATYTYTPLLSGWYQIRIAAGLINVAVGDNVRLYVLMNGSLISEKRKIFNGIDEVIEVSYLAFFDGVATNAAARITNFTRNTSNVSASSSLTMFQIHRVG